MSGDAEVLEAHPELIAAREAIAHTDNRLHAIQSEALRLAPLSARAEIAPGDIVDYLIDVARAYGLCGTDRDLETVEHVIRMGLAGQSAGVGLSLAATGGNPFVADGAHRRAPLRPLNLAEFLELKLPARNLLLRPWLPEKGLAMIYAPRGIGKTLLALSLGYAVASAQELLGWQAPAPRRVLYVDGEMPANEMQHRVSAIIAGFTSEPAPDYFRMLSADVNERGLPDLATPGGQRAFDYAIGKAELVILDNISTLVRAGKENEAESWASVQGWLLTHRRAGRTILLIHHAGKSGEQRGTSKREDVLDTVIALRRPADYRADQGARFEVHFEKHRRFHGADAQSFEARYEERDSAAVWTRTELVEAELDRVAAAIREGSSVREAAERLGMKKSTVQRLKQRAAEQGLLDDVVSQCPGA